MWVWVMLEDEGAFVHGDMKRVAQQFSDGGVSPKLSPGMNWLCMR